MIKSLFTIFAFAAAAIAAPYAGDVGSEPTVSQVAAQCGNDQTISCCNTGNGNLISALQCVDVPVIAVPISQSCGGSNVAACCPTDGQTGLINLNAQCIPIAL